MYYTERMSADEVLRFVLKTTIPGLCIVCGIAYPPNLIAKKLNYKTDEEFALDKLNKLASRLKIQDINTSEKLLLDSEGYYKHHRLDLKNSYGIIRDIYIPTVNSNNRNINQVSILEIHNIGSKKYILSLGEPVKKKQLKLAYGI